MKYKTQMPRRQFIGAVTSCAAITSLPGILHAAAKEKWKMRLSTSSVQYGTLSVENACERIATLGFEAIDIWCPFGKCRHLDDVASRLGADGLKNLLSKHKLKLNAFSVYNGGYKLYAELLGNVGGGVAVQGSTGGCKPEELTKKMTAFIESLKPLAELAEKQNSYLAIENHGGSLLQSLDSIRAFTDINTSKRIGIALAPYHLQAAKISVPEAIKSCGDQLFFFYAWQKAPGIKELPGHGPTNVTPWLKALADINYSWYVNPFMHHALEPDSMSKALKKSRAYLVDCYDKMWQ